MHNNLEAIIPVTSWKEKLDVGRNGKGFQSSCLSQLSCEVKALNNSNLLIVWFFFGSILFCHDLCNLYTVSYWSASEMICCKIIYLCFHFSCDFLDLSLGIMTADLQLFLHILQSVFLFFLSLLQFRSEKGKKIHPRWDSNPQPSNLKPKHTSPLRHGGFMSRVQNIFCVHFSYF